MNALSYLFSILSVLSLLSMLVRHPWTVFLARRSTPPEVWSTGLFMETNMLITGVWTILFSIAAILSIAIPLWADLLLGACYCLLGRLSPRFGVWYSSWRLASLEKDHR